MTKPITSVAAMILYEEGGFELTDPVSRYIPSFADVRVFAGGSDVKPRDRPGHRADPDLAPADPHLGPDLRLPAEPPGRRDLPGRRASSGASRAALDLAGCCDAWAGLPLLFQPGTEWNYSVATDVLGRLVEVVSGQSLDEFFAEPRPRAAGHDRHGLLGRRRTGRRGWARCTPARPGRPGRARWRRSASRAYQAPRVPQRRRRPGVHRRRLPPLHPDAAGPAGQPGRRAGRRPAAEPADGGLHDPQPPARRRGPGVVRPRRCSPRRRCGAAASASGFAVVLDPVAGKTLTSAGEFSWGGAASTAFYVDPVEQLTVTLLHPAAAVAAPTRSGPSCASSSSRRWWTSGLTSAGRSLAPALSLAGRLRLAGRLSRAGGCAGRDGAGVGVGVGAARPRRGGAGVAGPVVLPSSPAGSAAALARRPPAPAGTRAAAAGSGRPAARRRTATST